MKKTTEVNINHEARRIINWNRDETEQLESAGLNKCHWASTNHRKMCKSHSQIKTPKFITQTKQKHERKQKALN